MAQRRRKKQEKVSPVIWVSAILAVALVVTVIVLAAKGMPDPTPTQPSTSGIHVEYSDADPIVLGQGLRIERVGAYTGIFMENGSNEAVTGTLMVILENASPQDLQLARFSLSYADFTAEFEVTNLPAGQKTVVLEKNGRKASGTPKSAKASTILFFQEKMTLMEGTLELNGQPGGIFVKNVSGKDISGNVWVYYKYSATDIFYGGITFRAKHTGGIKAGESVMIPAAHYHPNSVKVVWVTVGA